MSGLLSAMNGMFGSDGGYAGYGPDEGEMALYRAQLQQQLAIEDDHRAREYLERQYELMRQNKANEWQHDQDTASATAGLADSIFSPLLKETQDGNYSPALRSIVTSAHQMTRSGDPALVKQGLALIDDVGRKMTPQAESGLTSDVKEYRFAQSQGFGGSFADWLQQNAKNRQPFESEYDKNLGKAQAEEFLGIQQAPIKRSNVLNQMEQIHGLLGDRGGFMGSTLQEMKLAADRLGVPIAGLDADQAAAALSNDLALKLRSTGDGGGMPGAMSDADRQFLYKQVPSIDFTPQGRAKLIEIQRRLLAREAQVADLARAYASRHGRLDSGFYGALTGLRDQPLFDDLHQATGQAQPAGQGITVRRIR